MADYNVVGGELRSYALYLRHEPGAVDLPKTIKDQACLQGCDKDGFTGLMSPLAAGMDYLSGLMAELCDTAAARVNRVSDALVATADDYQHVDRENEKTISKPMGEPAAS